MLPFIVGNLLFFSCSTEPTTLPTQKQIIQEEGFTEPSPLYQLLYDSQPMPQPTATQQRLRIYIWLKKLNLNEDQLRQLQELRSDIQNRKNELIQKESKYSESLIEMETPIYNELWDAVQQGKELKNQEEAITKLRVVRNQDPSVDIQKLRIDSIRAIFEAQNAFLQTLTPEQEFTIMEALFFLRHHIDPIGTPSDFYTLIGKTYEPGQYAVLTRGGSMKAQETLNIGGLWTDKEELGGKAFHEAKRELILYLTLLEPGVDDAIQVTVKNR